MKLSIMIKSNDKKGIQMKYNPFFEGRKFVEKKHVCAICFTISFVHKSFAA